MTKKIVLTDKMVTVDMHTEPLPDVLMVLEADKSTLTRKAYQTTLLRTALLLTGSEDYHSVPWHETSLEQWVMVREGLARDLMPVTLGKYLGHLRSLVSVLFDLGMIPLELRERVHKVLRVKDAKSIREPRALSTEDIEAVRATFDSSYIGVRDRALFDTLIYTGARRFEAVVLTWDNIDMELGRIKIVNGKGARTDWIPLHETAVQSLQALYPVRKGARVFELSERGITHRVSVWVKVSGIQKFTPHDLRRTLGSEVYRQTGSIRSAQLVLRHENAVTTQKYIMDLHDAEDKIDAINSVDF